MKIVELHTCGCPIGHADLSPSWSLKTQNFIVFSGRHDKRGYFAAECPENKNRVLYFRSWREIAQNVRR